MVGDIFAGVQTQLTVATFNDPNPYVTANSFTVQINWGDGQSGGLTTVTGANGAYTVHAMHAYAVAGGYTVQVQLFGDGQPLTAASQVLVAPSPAGTFQAAVAAIVNVPLGPAPLAVFSLPNFGQAGPYTATIDYGDGTPDGPVSLATYGALLDVVGNHVYTTAGQFAVKTLVRNAAGFMAAVAVSAVFVDDPRAEPSLIAICRPRKIRWCPYSIEHPAAAL